MTDVISLNRSGKGTLKMDSADDGGRTARGGVFTLSASGKEIGERPHRSDGARSIIRI
jgi:hypothetical protein